MNTIISIILLATACYYDNPMYAIASGIYAIAASISGLMLWSDE